MKDLSVRSFSDKIRVFMFGKYFIISTSSSVSSHLGRSISSVWWLTIISLIVMVLGPKLVLVSCIRSLISESFVWMERWLLWVIYSFSSGFDFVVLFLLTFRWLRCPSVWVIRFIVLKTWFFSKKYLKNVQSAHRIFK